MVHEFDPGGARVPDDDADGPADAAAPHAFSGPAAAVPLTPYRRRRRGLAEEVREEIYVDFIRSGAVPPGQRLPSETELSARYSVSRVTLRSAMRSLHEAGYVSIRQGVGTLVLPQSEALLSGLDQLLSFETLARGTGMSVGTEDLTMVETPAAEEISAKLGLPPNDPGILVERAKTFAGARVAWMVDFVPARILPPDRVRSEFRGSVLDVLLAYPELGIEYAECDVMPVALDAATAERLHVPAGTAALCMDELTRSGEGRAVFWGTSWMLPEHLRFTLRRRKRFRS